MIPLLVGPVAALIDTVVKRVIPDPEIQARLTLELAKADWSIVQAQLSVNAEEAKHESVFVAGWRPFIGWVCGASLAWNFVALPLVTFAAGASGAALPPLPELAVDTLMPVLLGMLGLGGLRTYEKVTGSNKRR
ncbi:MAG: 3TM-type holin [Egibacteraceae bacterium]